MSEAQLSPAWTASRRALVAGTIFALIGAAFYGANIPAARVASQAGMPGADIAFYRALLVAPLVAMAALAMRQSLRPAAGETGPLVRLAIASGLTGTFYLSALDHLPVPLAVVIFYTFPLIVMLVSQRLEGRRLAARQVAVFAGAFLGLMLAVGPSLDILSLAGALLAFLAACAAAAMFVIAGRLDAPPVRSMFWVQIGTLPIALGFALLQGGPAPLSAFSAAPIAIAIAMGGYAIAFALQLAASQRISPSRAGLLFLFEPVTAIVIAVTLLGEKLAPMQAAGVALILAALAAEMVLDRPAESIGFPDART